MTVAPAGTRPWWFTVVAAENENARRLLEAVDVAANVLADADLANREDPAAYPGSLPSAEARALAHSVYSLVELLPDVLVPLAVGTPVTGRAGGAARQVAIQLHLHVRRLVVLLESSTPPSEPNSR